VILKVSPPPWSSPGEVTNSYGGNDGFDDGCRGNDGCVGSKGLVFDLGVPMARGLTPIDIWRNYTYLLPIMVYSPLNFNQISKNFLSLLT